MVLSLQRVDMYTVMDNMQESSINLSWVTQSSLEMKIGENRLNIILKPKSYITGMNTPCLFEGELEEEEDAVAAVIGFITAVKPCSLSLVLRFLVVFLTCL